MLYYVDNRKNVLRECDDMRPEVIELQKLGVFPREADATFEQLQIIEQLLIKITRPVTDDEARILIQLFDPTEDGCYGMAWTLLSLIETAPSLIQIIQENIPSNNDWVNFMVQRAQNAGYVFD